MRPQPTLLLALLASVPTVVAGQLPFLTAPVGTLRIEFGGRFDPASRERADGTVRDLADPIRRTDWGLPGDPLVRDMATRLGGLLGRAVTDGTLGALGAELEYQRGTGLIGLAVGVTPRLTVALDIPIVSIRTQAALVPDATAATLGRNPATLGDQSAAAYLGQLDVALDALAVRLGEGAFDGDPTLRADAEALLADGPAFRAALDAFLVDPATASAVLPLASSQDGTDLLGTLAAYRDQFGTRFGVEGFTAQVALPTAAVTDAEVEGLLTAPTGYGFAPTTDPPLVALGDVRLGATYAILDGADGLRAWGEAGVQFPTGTAPRPDVLRDQGTGTREWAVDLGGVVEIARGPIGLRSRIGFRRGFASEREVRIGTVDERLLHASRTTLLQRTPGTVLRLEAFPYLRIADHFALVGTARWMHEGETSWSETLGTTPTSGGVIAAMGEGTSRRALVVGLGLSYAHDGVNREGERRMPVEAGLGIERLAASSGGPVAARLTTTLRFRVYKRLFSR
ncbi:MAG: hypothetical protein R3B35_08025 [Gemmatimonadales bacterium]